MKIVIVFCILSISISCCSPQKVGVLHSMPKKYEVNNYMYEITDLKPSRVDFNIEMRKSNYPNHYWIYFGNTKQEELISYSNDTVYFYPEKEENLKLKNTLFILNTKALQDTNYISRFGAICDHSIALENLYYNSTINDTVYSFKLLKKREGFRKITIRICIFSSRSTSFS